jgi:hypothetical protein
MDNLNQIVCGSGVGYRIDKIRRVWIIHKFADHPIFRIGYPIISFL